MVAMLVTVLHHGAMIGPALIPNLVHEVLLLEHLEELVLLARVYKVQPLLERVVPLVVCGQVVLEPPIARLLLELLKNGLVSRMQGPIARQKAGVVQIVLFVDFVNVVVDAVLARLDLVHDPYA